MLLPAYSDQAPFPPFVIFVNRFTNLEFARSHLRLIFPVRVVGEVGFEDVWFAVGVVFAAFDDGAVTDSQGCRAVEVVVQVVEQIDKHIVVVHRQDFVYIVAVDEFSLEVVGVVVFDQDLPVGAVIEERPIQPLHLRIPLKYFY